MEIIILNTARSVIRNRRGNINASQVSNVVRAHASLDAHLVSIVGGASMFEDSLVESRIGPISASKRWTALASLSLQFAVAAIIIALPLLHHEALPSHADTPKLLLPPTPKPPVPVTRVEPTSASSASVAAPSVARTMVMPSLLLTRLTATTEVPTLAPIGASMGMHEELPVGIAFGPPDHGPSVTVARERSAAGPLHISTGVSQGLLLAPIRPVYPAIAKAAHVEGTVIVEAVISRTGSIESLHVVSGPLMLQRAAIDAIQAARYRPYRLNGAAIVVETTIMVNFRMGS
jgi:protein TonB